MRCKRSRSQVDESANDEGRTVVVSPTLIFLSAIGHESNSATMHILGIHGVHTRMYYTR